MRILQVIPHLSKGGAERVVIELANSLTESGHDVSLLMKFPVDFELNQKYLDGKVKVRFISKRQMSPILIYLKLPFWIVWHWNSLRKFDVIHCHLTFGLIFGYIIFKIRKITRHKDFQLIATCHMVGGGVTSAYRYFNRRVSYAFDAFVLMAQDDYWREFIRKSKRTDIYIVANGISADPALIHNSEQSVESAIRIGTISRLIDERKPWLFLEVFAQVLKLDPKGEYRFIVGGDGPEREKLKHLAHELDLDETLVFAGLVIEPAEILSRLDLYVSLNVEDISGIAGLEAVFAGLPVVALQLSLDYVKGTSDWIWSDPNPAEVAAKILDLVKNPEKMRELSSTQHLYACREYSTEQMTRGYLKIYSI